MFFKSIHLNLASPTNKMLKAVLTLILPSWSIHFIYLVMLAIWSYLHSSKQIWFLKTEKIFTRLLHYTLDFRQKISTQVRLFLTWIILNPIVPAFWTWISVVKITNPNPISWFGHPDHQLRFFCTRVVLTWPEPKIKANNSMYVHYLSQLYSVYQSCILPL